MCVLISPLKLFCVIFGKTMSLTLLLTSPKLSSNVRVLSFHCHRDKILLLTGGINYLKNHPDMIENSFCVCGITTNNPGKIRNDEFLKKIMNSVKDKLADEEDELLADDIVFHAYNRLIMIIL